MNMATVNAPKMPLINEAVKPSRTEAGESDDAASDAAAC